MKLLRVSALVCALLVFSVVGQERPFPQTCKFPYGFMPSTISTANLEKWYSSYKANTNLLHPCGNGVMPGTDSKDEGKIEAQGWAMIIAAYMGEKADFDGLYSFYKTKIQGHGMAGWKYGCNGVSESGSATDGDLDVAYSLVVAYWQWGDAYLEEAKKTINTCKKLITNCSGTSVLFGGMAGMGGYGGCQETDISYYTPAFFRAFAEVTGDQAWTKLADDTYTVLNNAANSTTGLVPDWHKWNGGSSQGSHSSAHTYRYDACRVPWRIALDYLWNGNEKAKAWCTKISNWANGVGIKNIKDEYSLDGRQIGNYHNMSFVGGLAVAAMCNSQEIADDFANEVASMPFDNFWYHAYLGNCYMLTMTGNMWHKNLKCGSDVSVPLQKTVATSGMKISHNGKLIISGLNRNCQSIVITDLQGNRILKSSVTQNASALIDVNMVKRGCYIVSAIDGQNRVQQKQKMILQ